MLTAITIHFLPLGGMLLFAFIVGFLLRSAQLKIHHKKVIELEREMLSNHSEILDLQKERAALLKQMKESRIPVIPMNVPKEEKKDKFQAGQ